MSCLEADKREESSIPAPLFHHSKGRRRLPQPPRRALAFFAGSSGTQREPSRQWRSRRAACCQTTGEEPTWPERQRRVKRWLWRHEIQSVETGSREKVAQKRRRDEPVWWAEGSHFPKERHRNVVKEASDQRKPHMKNQADLSHQTPHGCAENHEDSAAGLCRTSGMLGTPLFS